jgi:hypothetical protein
MKTKKTMLSAVQKVKMAMGKMLPKLSKPSLNAGFEKLPESVQNKMMKVKKAKMVTATKKKQNPYPPNTAAHKAFNERAKNSRKELQANLDKMATKKGREQAKKEAAKKKKI